MVHDTHIAGWKEVQRQKRVTFWTWVGALAFVLFMLYAGFVTMFRALEWNHCSSWHKARAARMPAWPAVMCEVQATDGTYVKREDIYDYESELRKKELEAIMKRIESEKAKIDRLMEEIEEQLEKKEKKEVSI